MSLFDVTLESTIDEYLACPDEDVGQVLELKEIVGKGGFATVWKASFEAQLCACKVLQPRGGTRPPAPIVRLFIRECASLMSMEHSAIIRCAGLIRMRMVDFPELGLTYDTYGMLLEFCEGGTLKDLLLAQLVYKQEQYSVREALGWLAQVASALHQFHCLPMPIIHRDIKPENILLQPSASTTSPGFWDPPSQQQNAGLPRIRMGRGGVSGRGSFRALQHLEAKLADLGLGVRVCANRSVLIRRRATPVEGPLDAAAAAAPAASPTGVDDDEALQMLFGSGGGGSEAQRVEDVRMPFMGFTTTPVKPPSRRLSSNQRKPSRSRSHSCATGGGGCSPPGPGGGLLEAALSASPPTQVELHRTALLKNVQARLSGTREGARSWYAHGEGLAAAAAAPAGAVTSGNGGGGDTDGGGSAIGGTGLPTSPPYPGGGGERSPPPPPSPLPPGGGSSSACGRGGGGAWGHYADGPNPFRDFLQEQQQQRQRQEQQQPGSPGTQTTTTATTTSAAAGSTTTLAGGGFGVYEAMGPSARASGIAGDRGGSGGGGGLSMSYSQSLGHGARASSLAPISERSLSAEDTITSTAVNSECRSGTARPSTGGGVTLTGSGGGAATTAGLLDSLQMSVSRPPPGRNHHHNNNNNNNNNNDDNILYTIQEPGDCCPSPHLSTAASAPATAGNPQLDLHPQHRLTHPPSKAQPHQHHSSEPGLDESVAHHTHHPSSPHHSRQHQQHRSGITGVLSGLQGGVGSPSSSPARSPGGMGRLAAAAASVRQSLRRAAAAAGAAVLTPRRGGVRSGGGDGGDGGGGGAGHDSEPAFLLQSTTSVPISAPACRIDLEPKPNHHQQEQHHQQHPPPPQQQQQCAAATASASSAASNPNGDSTAELRTYNTVRRDVPLSTGLGEPTGCLEGCAPAPPPPPPSLPPPPSPPPPLPAGVAVGSMTHHGSRAIETTSSVAATAAASSHLLPQLPRGETCSAFVTATDTSTATAVISSRPSRERTSFGISSLVRPTLRELRHSESLSRAMRRVGSLLRSLKVPSLPKFRRGSQFQWVYGLTGQAGSCMYMAPEVFRGEPYNEKVDVHSFGVMMYELLARDLLLLRYIGGTRQGLEIGVKDPHHFAKKVCDGFRPPRHPKIPEKQWQLIQACWHPDPLVRPDMAEVVAQLEASLEEWGLQQQHPQRPTTLPGPGPDRVSGPPHKNQQQQQQQPEQQQDRNNSSSSSGDTPKQLTPLPTPTQMLPQPLPLQQTKQKQQKHWMSKGADVEGHGGSSVGEGLEASPWNSGCRCVIS